MFSQLDNSDDIEKFINDIIQENTWAPVIDVKYHSETTTRNVNTSKHIFVDIITKNETHNLVVKHGLHLKRTLFDVLYSNETYFYDVIYPLYTDFLYEKGIENGFENVPRSYGTSTKNIIALENLKEKGFTLLEEKEEMDDEHIILTLKSLAKLHATSYAFKDQRRQDYKKFKKYLCRDFVGIETKEFNSSSIRIIGDVISDALSKLDVETDRHILSRCNVEDLVHTLTNIEKNVNEFSTLIQGECWCKNMMFLLQKGRGENPVDMIFLDWHLIRLASPVLDISYFLYTMASEVLLNKIDTYLNTYYTKLCDEVRKLGSNAGLLYPHPVFKREWKQYCKYGFAAAFILIKFILMDQDDTPKVKGEIQSNNLDTVNFLKLNEKEYVKRIRILGNFMIDNDYL